MPWWIVYALLTLATMLIVATAYARDKFSFLGVPAAATVLCATFILSLFSFEALGPLHRLVFPAMDLTAGAFFVLQWRANLKWWALSLAMLFLMEMAQHAAYYTLPDHGFMARYTYDLYLNANYVLQLACVAFPAILTILARRGAATQR